MTMAGARGLGWLGIVRLGLVQTSIGAIVVLTKSVLNRVMVVELGLAAVLPGFLFGLYYGTQLARPWLGHGSDGVGRRRTPWIIGGLAALAVGAIAAAGSVALMDRALWLGIAAACASFLIIGLGVGAAGTSLLVLLSKQVAEARKAAAAMIAWVMMIAGFIVTTAVAGSFLDPFTLTRLISVTAVVSLIAFTVTCLAVIGVERPGGAGAADQGDAKPAFRKALAEAWTDPQARLFTVFVFISMIGYSAQDLILEPYAGLVFDFTPGQSTKLTAMQNSGALTGMLLVGILGSFAAIRARIPLRKWTVIGCSASACALMALALTGPLGADGPLRSIVFALGFSNGMFAVAAVGSMMVLASYGPPGREGVRMGLWGASQAIAMGLGEVSGTIGVDAVRLMGYGPATAYGSVFAAEAVLFAAAAIIALKLNRALTKHDITDPSMQAVGGRLAMEGPG
ncbi:MAG: BCD family MFS transporter [Rhodothalassiaceae bacterium]